MKAKLIDTNDIYVKVEPNIGNVRLNDTEKEIEIIKDTCRNIINSIDRHVDDVNYTSIDIKRIYEFEDDYGTYEANTLQQLCEDMAIQRYLLDINNRWEVFWVDNNNEKHSAIEWELEELLYRIANNNVIKIIGRLNKYQRTLVDMAMLLNDNKLNIDLEE